MNDFFVGKRTKRHEFFTESRDAMIKEVVSWPIFNEDGSNFFKNLYEDDNYYVRMTKNGKETDRDDEDKCNPHDCCVNIIDKKTGEPLEGFNKENYMVHLFCERLYNKGYYEFLKLLTLMFIRAAGMYDHIIVDDKYRYVPDEKLLKLLKYECELHPEIVKITGVDSLPILLCYIDTLAIQEDVKYNVTPAYKKINSEKKGRYNNLTSHAFFCSVMLGYFGEDKYAIIARRYEKARGVCPLTERECANIVKTITSDLSI